MLILFYFTYMLSDTKKKKNPDRFKVTMDYTVSDGSNNIYRSGL